jgi:hypothetical protein
MGAGSCVTMGRSPLPGIRRGAAVAAAVLLLACGGDVSTAGAGGASGTTTASGTTATVSVATSTSTSSTGSGGPDAGACAALLAAFQSAYSAALACKCQPGTCNDCVSDAMVDACGCSSVGNDDAAAVKKANDDYMAWQGAGCPMSGSCPAPTSPQCTACGALAFCSANGTCTSGN